MQNILLMQQLERLYNCYQCDPRWVHQLKEGHECLNIYLNIKPQVFKTHTHSSADVLSEF